ncbi:MAG: hypothetical protein MJ189_01375 [Coriobacteriales bacterium]|nr:hypothetical protein [Coriobacteriales bacterium]
MKKKALIIVLIVVVLLVIAGIVTFVIHNNAIQDQKHQVPLIIDAESYDDENSTAIPVAITGKNVKNEDVDELQYVNGKGQGIELKKGQYCFSFVASPLCKSGIFYKCPQDLNDVKIDNSLGDKPICDVLKDTTLTFEIEDSASITDDELNAAYEYAQNDNNNGKFANEYMDNTKKARDEAIANAKKIEEQKIAAQKQQSEDEMKRLVLEAINPSSGYVLDVFDFHQEGNLLLCTVCGENPNTGKFFKSTDFVFDISNPNAYRKITSFESGINPEFRPEKLLNAGFSKEKINEITGIKWY